jgi:hypothetical protein
VTINPCIRSRRSNASPLTCGTRESRYHRARGVRASAARCRQVQRLVSLPG